MIFRRERMHRTGLIVLFCTYFGLIPLDLVQGHNRLECPPPRSGETGQKASPCDAPDNPDLAAYPLIPGALNTITWLESLSHPGAPARLALSRDGEDDGFEDCLLLDHIPHDELSQPLLSDELSYHRTSITIFLPDIYCERCHLQLITFMTDEAHGVDPGASCAYFPAQQAGRASSSLLLCPVVYHSCAPVSINGTVPRNDIAQCNTSDFEARLDWPFIDMPHSTYFYKGDPGMYNQTTSQLLSGGAPVEGCNNFVFCDPNVYYNPTEIVPADAAYTRLEGTCANVVNTVVEPFALGQLPSVPKGADGSAESIDCTPLTQCIFNTFLSLVAIFT